MTFRCPKTSWRNPRSAGILIIPETISAEGGQPVLEIDEAGRRFTYKASTLPPLENWSSDSSLVNKSHSGVMVPPVRTRLYRRPNELAGTLPSQYLSQVFFWISNSEGLFQVPDTRGHAGKFRLSQWGTLINVHSVQKRFIVSTSECFRKYSLYLSVAYINNKFLPSISLFSVN